MIDDEEEEKEKSSLEMKKNDPNLIAFRWINTQILVYN